MKFTSARFRGLVEQLGNYKLVLLYGDNEGLIQEYADTLIRAVAGSPDDPFRFVTLDRDSHPRIEEEATALSLTGGRRAVRIREPGDALTATLRGVLESAGDALLVVEAGGLPPRSSLRVLAETHPRAASVACYADERAGLVALVRDSLREAGVRADADVAEMLVDAVNADRAAVRAELVKLVLYAGETGRLSVADVRACVADGGAVAVGDVVDAALIGDIAAVDRQLGDVLAESGGAVGLLRNAMSQLAVLTRMRLAVESGTSPAQAVEQAMPRLFFKRKPILERIVERLDVPLLSEAATAMFAAERATRQTGAPADVIVAHAIRTLAMRAAARHGDRRRR